MRRSLTSLFSVVLLLVLLLLPSIAAAQTPMPGEEPEPVREWVWLLSFPIIAGTLLVVLLVAFSYVRLSSRFYAKEEPPKVRRQPIYAGVNAPAYPAPVTQQAAPPPAQQAPPDEQPAPAQQEAPAATAVKERPAQEAPPVEEQPSTADRDEAAASEAAAPKEDAASSEETVAADQDAEAPAETEAGEAEAPAAEAQEQPEEQPAAETEEQPAAETEEQPKPEAEQPAGSGDDVYERVLKEQLDKGVSPKVAEGRAKAAALKASRQAGG